MRSASDRPAFARVSAGSLLKGEMMVVTTEGGLERNAKILMLGERERPSCSNDIFFAFLAKTFLFPMSFLKFFWG